MRHRFGFSLSVWWGRDDAAKQSMLLALQARSKVDRIDIACCTAVAGCERPQRLVDQRFTVSTSQLTEKSIGRRIKHVDRAIAEISDQQIVRKTAEGWRGNRQTPR